MISRVASLCVLLVCGSGAQQPSSRSVSRSSDGGTVNLVEFGVRGVTYGRCSFRNGGEEITAMYEERGDEMIAATNNPTILDPVSKARMCRELASKPPPSLVHSRSDFGEATPETEMELLSRLKEFETKIAENQDYINHLKPRFVTLLTNLWSDSTNKDTFGFTYGTGPSSLSSLFSGSNSGFNIDYPTISNSNFLKNWFGKRR